jgi:NhaA family Na+:H+ antiporter
LALGIWWLTHESGVHATVAGVAMGFATRVKPDPHERESPAEALEHILTPYSAALAVPFFALTSAGVKLNIDLGYFSDPVVIGILLGLLVGKPVGVFGGAWLVTKLTHAELGAGMTWRDVAAVATLAGIGFTVALLVADLSFEGQQLGAAKAAVLIGSVTAGLLAAAQIRFGPARRAERDPNNVNL